MVDHSKKELFTICDNLFFGEGGGGRGGGVWKDCDN